MARLVMKFGGTSVADLDRIRNVARHVKREVDAGHDVAVVVSAMAGVTNQLIEWSRQAAMVPMPANTMRLSPPGNKSPPDCSQSRSKAWA
jgi:Aspartokinases